jgi:hypothetical protein
MTGVLFLKAQIGLILCGKAFGVYWFEYEAGANNIDKLRIQKHLGPARLTRINTTDELIKFAAHLAFFLSDPHPQLEPPLKRSRHEQALVLDTTSTVRIESIQEAPKDITSTDNPTGVESTRSAVATRSGIVVTSLTASYTSDVQAASSSNTSSTMASFSDREASPWEQIQIVGPTGAVLTCVRPRDSLDPKQLKELIGEIEPEQDP